MAKKKKKDRGKQPPVSGTVFRDDEGEAVVLPSVPQRISNPFAEALKGMKAAPPSPKKAPAAAAPVAKPTPVQSPAEKGATMRDAMNQLDRAYRGVTKLGDKAVLRRAPPSVPVRPPEARRGAEDSARAELASFVAGGIQFHVERDEDGRVVAHRKEHGPQVVKELKNGRATPGASLDLHGFRGDEAEVRVVAFLREARMRGVRVALIIHGKGMHSEGGDSVLRDRVQTVLARGGGAPLCVAFRTAAEELGGLGAVLVLLSRVK